MGLAMLPDIVLRLAISSPRRSSGVLTYDLLDGEIPCRMCRTDTVDSSLDGRDMEFQWGEGLEQSIGSLEGALEWVHGGKLC
jgi:hypothetical protein